MLLHKKISIIVFVAYSCVFTALVSVSHSKCFSTAWPHEKSDIAPDPSMLFGKLDNGFRYVLMKNTEPKNRVAMSLNIQAGSLNETDAQRGIAHFLEHMLFNGSTHFPPGKLIEYFQSIGMSFGGDTNAHTGYDETVYDIILPHGNPDEIAKGLLVFSDYARGALLLQTEIDRERGVILAEKRSRDSAAYRAQVKDIEFSMRGTLLPERMPIGILETLNAADHTLMKQFYDNWYRPDNMVLVMVGDFDPKEIQPLVTKQFAGLKAAGDKPKCPEIGALNRNTLEFFYHHEAETGATQVSVESMWNVETVDDSILFERKVLSKYIANEIVQLRLDDLEMKSDTPFTTANIYSGRFLEQIGYASIGAESSPDKWKESLVLIEKTLRQALEFGFTEDELQRVKKELIVGYDTAILTAGSRNSKMLAASIIRSVNGNKVMQSPKQERELLDTILQEISLARIEESFREEWSHPGRLVKVNGNAVLPEEKDSLATIQSVYEEAGKGNVIAYAGERLQNFPYLHLDTLGSVKSQEKFDDVGVTRFVFDNNVILNLKKTDFQENTIQFSADFGGGKQTETIPGLAALTETVIEQSGTATLSQSSLDRITSGSSVETRFAVNSASFSWEGRSLNTDAELLFQVIQSLIADATVGDDAYQVSMDRFKQSYESMASDVQGAMTLYGKSFLADGNQYFGLPSWTDFSQIPIEQIKSWYLPTVSGSSLEISIVGDFDEKKILALARKYFSVLTDRTNLVFPETQISFPKGESLALTVPSSIDKAMLVLAWKTDDYWNIQRTRSMLLVAEIFSDKMRRVIREKLGATYSPRVYNVASRVHKGYGVMQANLIVDPAQIEVLQKEVLSIARDMWQGNITAAELERAKEPVLTSIRDMIRNNSYWLNSVLSLSSRYPEKLQWPKTILNGFEGNSVEDMKKYGKQYLNPKKVAVISIVPE